MVVCSVSIKYYKIIIINSNKKILAEKNKKETKFVLLQINH